MCVSQPEGLCTLAPRRSCRKVRQVTVNHSLFSMGGSIPSASTIRLHGIMVTESEVVEELGCDPRN